MEFFSSPQKASLSLIAVSAAGLLSLAGPALAGSISGCSYNGKALKGKVKVVSSHADIKVQIVSSHPDLKVKKVSSSGSSCGEWQFVDSHPDFTIQFVNSHPDIKVQYVSSFPGTS